MKVTYFCVLLSTMIWRIYFYTMKALCLSVGEEHYAAYLGIIHTIAINTSRQMRHMEINAKDIPIWYRIIYRYQNNKIKYQMNDLLKTIQREANECNYPVFGWNNSSLNGTFDLDMNNARQKWCKQRVFASQLVELSLPNMITTAWHLSLQTNTSL